MKRERGGTGHVCVHVRMWGQSWGEGGGKERKQKKFVSK